MDQRSVNQGLRLCFDSLRRKQIQAQMSYKHLTYEERFTIESLDSKEYPYINIDDIIGRYPSTLWCELSARQTRIAHTIVSSHKIDESKSITSILPSITQIS
jgi:hypothetical protein